MSVNKDIRILIVDDFSAMRGIIRNILNQLQFENIIEASDGTVAWEILEKDKIDFIISDWNMPGMTGIELLRKVRDSEQYSDIPFLMVTAEAQQKNILEAVQARVSDYIIKPFKAEILIQKIKKIFEYNQLFDPAQKKSNC